MSLLFVHSPLVGPSSCAPLGERAMAQEYAIAVPDLTRVADAEPPRWEAFVAAAAEAGLGLEPPIAVIGHSGAGVFLPEIGRRLGARMGALVFVDAVVPPRHGTHHTSDAMARFLDQQTTDGMLRRWLEWWPPETVGEILPDPNDRVSIAADLPVLPRSFYDEDVPVPDGWSDRKCAYLRLSAAYDAEYKDASHRGWARMSIDGTHLSIYTQPAQVLTAIEGLLDRIEN
jgi:hypothetical protein